MEILANYCSLVAKVDILCQGIAREFGACIRCRPGCADCCRHLALFPVEAFALALALQRLPAGTIDELRQRAVQTAVDGPCPLLDEGLCLLYGVRPLICRTHGYPFLTRIDGAASIDFCPRNFTGVSSLPGGAIIDLDQLNTTLAAINVVFCSECPPGILPAHERLSLAEALLLDLSGVL